MTEAAAGAPFIGYHGAAEQFPPGELVEFAVSAEQAGFDGLTISDHFHPWQDNQGHAAQAWLTLAAAGQRTERLLLGTGVTCPTYRYHPSLVAHGFATLAALYPGRVFLGLGTGEALNELSAGGGWGPYRERAGRLVEAIHLIRRLWSGEWVDFEGRYYQVKSARLYDPPPSQVPIYVAASGPRSAAIAGREADGWITDAATARRGERVQMAFVEAAREAGKDAGMLVRSVELWVVVGSTEEALQCARLWRFLPVFGDVVGIADPREVERTAERKTSLDRVVDGWVVGEDPAVHIEAIRELASLGVTRVFIHSPQEDQRAVIEYFGRQVLPAIRAG